MSARTLLLGSVMIVIAALFVGSVQDPDFWWHIRIGRWMVENGRLPSTDIFTYTVPIHVWTDHEYLTEVLMWLIYSTAGAIGIAIFFGVITYAGFYLMYRQVRREPFVIVGVGLAVGAVAGAPIWGPRAQMITFALTCLELYWLQGYLSGRSRALQWFPLVIALWANLHGGWVIGFVWLGVALVAELIGWAWNPSNPAHRVHVRFLAIISAACAVAVLATPHGFSLYLYPFQTVASAAQERLIVEWFSPDFHQPFLRPFEVMVFLLVAGFALRRPTVYDLLLSLVALGLSLQSVRNVALFVAAATPVLIRTYSGYWKEVSAARGWKLALPSRSLFAAITALALLVVALATTVHIASEVSPSHQQSLTASNYPVAAADWLAAHPEVGTKMYNQYGWGGYLAYRFYPQPNRRVFIFGEAALMGDGLLNDYQAIQTLRSNWKTLLDGYGVDYVVYNRGEALANVLATQPDWKLVYEDSEAQIYVRVKLLS
ncbi:MAG: hypothetical protein AUJ02_01480 [Chloroflexi bacterium 13_1_40CM_3_65_12]|nr:MAG: hypothetical protein AUH69_03045 [Actinobacteria bacterium 13_1_40CM_4_65_12]OLD26755.1 MAG: hypothetical protein AUJ02_01480 [Chloroflexi bacterium 13_1_40CM_3_65_12]OLD48831.1 MAG: hypothetical protein AUI42_10645 [Actinobacteria bacterium 13_1_40CM_2_65_8]